MKNKKLCFFDFSTLEYGGGCEKNFMNLGSWFSNRSYDVEFISGSKKINNLYCSLTRMGEHTQNISEEKILNEFKVKSYSQFQLKDLFLPTANRKRIQKAFSNATVIVARNEIVDVITLRYFLRVDMEKVVFGFHTALNYPFAPTIKSKLHNYIYHSKIYFNILGKARVRCLVLTDQDKKIIHKNAPNTIVEVIPNPVDTDKFSQRNLYKGNLFKIGYVGRMISQKGIDTLEILIRNLSETSEFKKMYFQFIGDGPEAYRLKNLSKEFSNCKYEGFTSDVLAFYKEFDLVLVPSRGESFCYSVAEAQSCGVVVIASNISGPKDIIIQNKTGWLVDAENIHDWSKSLLNAFKIWNSDYGKYSQYGLDGRANVINKFSKEDINLKIEHFLFIEHEKNN